MTEKLEVLDAWSFPDKELIRQGYDMTSVPKLTQDNFIALVNAHNEMVEVVNTLLKEYE